MARINKTNEQERALKIIISDIKRISVLNNVFEQDKKTEIATASISVAQAKVNITIDRKEIEKILDEERKELIKEVTILSKKYSIELDDEDLDIVKKREENKKTEKEKEEDIKEN